VARESSAEDSRTSPEVPRRPARRPSPHAIRHAGGKDGHLQRARRVGHRAQQSSAEVSRTLAKVPRRPAGRPSPHAIRHASGEDRSASLGRMSRPAGPHSVLLAGGGGWRPPRARGGCHEPRWPAMIASFGGRAKLTAQFHQNSRSCGASRPAQKLRPLFTSRWVRSTSPHSAILVSGRTPLTRAIL
jgi:hypothetical protein